MPKKSNKDNKEPKKKSNVLKRIVVDLWGTDLHAVEIGIRKQELHQSKDRQFSKDMEIFGVIREEREKVGYIGFRKGAFEEAPHESRLIIKTFSESVRWTGTIEEIIATSLTNSLVTERSTPAFIVNIGDYKPLIQMEAIVAREILPGKAYGFFLFHPEQKILNMFRIREDRLTFGDDWNVNDATGKRVARINERVLNIGGKFIIDLFDETLKDDDVFIKTLVLFAGMLKFRKDLEKKLKLLLKKMKGGKFGIVLSKEEVKLFQNPRRLAY